VGTLTAFLSLCALATSVWAQSPSTRVPRFEEYPAGEIYSGTPATPKIITPLQRKYRTRITEGVEKGWGAFRDGNEQDRAGPNFAGSMVVVQWGCGSPCMMMAMVDARTGTIYYPPISDSGVGVDSLFLPLLTIGRSVPANPDVQFRLDSRLMIVKATPHQAGQHPSYTYYFLWRDDRWTLLRQIPLKEE
jgi:hypothetical protein